MHTATHTVQTAMHTRPQAPAATHPPTAKHAATDKAAHCRMNIHMYPHTLTRAHEHTVLVAARNSHCHTALHARMHTYIYMLPPTSARICGHMHMCAYTHTCKVGVTQPRKNSACIGRQMCMHSVTASVQVAIIGSTRYWRS